MGNGVLLFWCPGCRELHGVWLEDNPNDRPGAWWRWNGDWFKPTFTPSILVQECPPQPRCHCFITEGRIQFLADCGHDLAGQTVPMAASPTDQS